MSTEIINVLNYICDKIGIAIDWTADNVWPQVMDILGRYRIFQLTMNVIYGIASLCVMILFAILWVRAFKSRNIVCKEHADTFWWHYNSYYEEISAEPGAIVLTVCTIFIGGFMIALFGSSINNFLTWLLVPEIQYLDMLKTYIQ